MRCIDCIIQPFINFDASSTAEQPPSTGLPGQCCYDEQSKRSKLETLPKSIDMVLLPSSPTQARKRKPMLAPSAPE